MNNSNSENEAIATISEGTGVVSIYRDCLTIAEVLSQFQQPIADIVITEFELSEQRKIWAQVLRSVSWTTTRQCTQTINAISKAVKNLEELSELDITSIDRLGYEGQCLAVLLYTRLVEKIYISKSVYETKKLDNPTMLSIFLINDVEFQLAKHNAHILSRFNLGGIETIYTTTQEELKLRLARLSFTDEMIGRYFDAILLLRKYCISTRTPKHVEM